MTEASRARPIDWASARRRRRGPLRLVAIAGLHLLALLALKAAIDRVERPVAGGERTTTLVEVALVRRPPPPPSVGSTPNPLPRAGDGARTRVTPPRARTAEPPAVPLAAPMAAPPDAPAVAPVVAATPPASAASRPRPDFLDTDATRLAIREAARHPSIAGRTGEVGPGANERLAQGVAASQLGDCMRGEFFGGGAGLLSAPFLLAAEALGKCSHK